MALAAHNYESSNGAFPLGNRGSDFIFSAALSSPCSVSILHSCFVFMLPYMEGTNGYNAFNVIRPWNSVSNITGQSTKLSSYVCPSDTEASPDPSGDIQPAQASYGAARGLQETVAFNWAVTAYPDPSGQYYSTCNNGGGDGMFGPENSVRISAVTDGTSNTFFFGEQSRFKNEPAGSGFWFNFITVWIVGPPWSAATTFWPNDGRPTGGASAVPKLNAPPDTTGAIQAACFGPCILPPDWINVPACMNYGQFGFRSLHPGGANFAMADGSVKFIKDSVNPQTYRALATRAGGEVISADQY